MFRTPSVSRHIRAAARSIPRKDFGGIGSGLRGEDLLDAAERALTRAGRAKATTLAGLSAKARLIPIVVSEDLDGQALPDRYTALFLSFAAEVKSPWLKGSAVWARLIRSGRRRFPPHGALLKQGREAQSSPPVCAGGRPRRL